MWAVLTGICIITWYISISKWAETGFLGRVFLAVDWNLVFCRNSMQLTLNLLLGLMLLSAMWLIERITESQNKRCVNIRKDTHLEVGMTINKPEAAFPQISGPADQDRGPLLHCCYLKIMLYSLWKHANPSKIHVNSILVKIPVVSIWETFPVWLSLIPDFYSLYIYHSRQVWNSYPMQ